MASMRRNWEGESDASGRYRVLRRLGAGGMGSVYQVHDRNIDADVVIKAPHPSMMEDPEFAARFTREIQALVRLSHPHIVKVSDVGAFEGIPFAVMQLLPGGSLETRRPRQPGGGAVPVGPGEVASWLGKIAAALDYAHSQQFIHRDVKPDNILFDAQGEPFLSDFGVARAMSSGQGAATSNGALTGTGMVLGTPEYMAPELIMGEAFDGRVDQYALAITVYELLRGRRPFEVGPDEPRTKLLVLQTSASPEPLSRLRPDLPARLCDVVMKGLSKNPAERFPTCSAFAAAFELAIMPAAGDGKVRLVCPRCGKTGRTAAADFDRLRKAGGKPRCPQCEGAMELADDGGSSGSREIPAAEGGHALAPATPFGGTMKVSASPEPGSGTMKLGQAGAVGSGTMKLGQAGAAGSGTMKLSPLDPAPADPALAGQGATARLNSARDSSTRGQTLLVEPGAGRRAGRDEPITMMVLPGEEDQDDEDDARSPFDLAAVIRAHGVLIGCGVGTLAIAIAISVLLIDRFLPPDMIPFASAITPGAASLPEASPKRDTPTTAAALAPPPLAQPARATPTPALASPAMTRPIASNQPKTTPPANVAMGDLNRGLSAQNGPGQSSLAQPSRPGAPPPGTSLGDRAAAADLSATNSPGARAAAPAITPPPTIDPASIPRARKDRLMLGKILETPAAYSGDAIIPAGMYHLQSEGDAEPGAYPQVVVSPCSYDQAVSRKQSAAAEHYTLDAEPRLAEKIANFNSIERRLNVAIVHVWFRAGAKPMLVKVEVLEEYRARFAPGRSRPVGDVDYLVRTISATEDSTAKGKDEDWETLERMLRFANYIKNKVRAMRNALETAEMAQLNKMVDGMRNSMIRSAASQAAAERALQRGVGGR